MTDDFKVISMRVSRGLPFDCIKDGAQQMGASWVMEASNEEAARLNALATGADLRKNWPYGVSIERSRM